MRQQLAIDFTDLEPIRLAFEHSGRPYVLCEASEGDFMAWRSYQTVNAKLDEKGNVVNCDPDRLFESRSYLVSLCLYDARPDGKPATDSNGALDPVNRVSVERVRALSRRLVERLADEVVRISDLAVKEDQDTLEKDYGVLVRKLVALADDPDEKILWLDWMRSEVDGLASEIVPRLEDAAKNGRVATPVTTA